MKLCDVSICFDIHSISLRYRFVISSLMVSKASDQVGCPVSHGEDGWIVSATPEGVAWGVKEVFGDWDRAREMGAKGRVKAAFSLSWDTVAELTEKAYTEF